MKRHRVQLSFNDEGLEELVKLEKEMGITRQDLFKYALRWLQWTYEEIKEGGGEIQIKERDGKVKTIVAPFLKSRKEALKGS